MPSRALLSGTSYTAAQLAADGVVNGTVLTVSAWGGGGAGGGSGSNGGGGGGEFAQSSYTVLSGDVSGGIAYTIGTGAANAAGGNTTWKSTVIVAKGGAHGSGGTGGAGGTGGTGTTLFDGGAGFSGTGGGGGGAGPNGAGGAGTSSAGGTGDNGSGGAGGGSNLPGSPSNLGGGGGGPATSGATALGGFCGGGGGSGASSTNVAGANGQIVVSGIPVGLTLVGVATASNTTVTVPTTQAGDLVIIYAFRGAATGAPTLPSGWTSIQSGNGTTCAARSGFKTATGSSTASGTWTNAAELVCHVYRAVAGYTVGIGQSAQNHQTTATVNYPALTMADSTSGNSWVVGFVGVRNLLQTINTPPAGMVNESNVQGATYAAAGHDTAGGVTAWSSTNVTTTGTATGSITHVIEIMLLPKANGLSGYVYQHVKGGGNPAGRGQSGNAFVLSLPNASGSGNLYVLNVTNDNGATISAISDTINGSWSTTAYETAVGGSGNLDSASFVLANIGAGQNVITFTFGANVTTFTYELWELYNVATSSPTNGKTSAAFTTATAAGSFTPGANTGGNVLISYHAKAATSPSNITTLIRPGANFSLASADIGWNQAATSMTYASQGYVQTTPVVINPAITSCAETGDDWNNIAIAIKVSSGSGTAPSGMMMSGIGAFSTLSFPTSGNYNLQCPATGNLRCITCHDPNLHSTTLVVTDSEGNTWSNDGTALPTFWYFANASANPNLEVYTTNGGTDNVVTWLFYDIAGAATSPFDSAVDSNQSVSSTTSFTASPSPSPTSAAGMTIASIGLGQGPGLAVTSPSGAIFNSVTYTGELDTDLIDNADLYGTYSYAVSGSQTWTFTITSVVSNSTSGGFISFQAASTGPSATLASAFSLAASGQTLDKAAATFPAAFSLSASGEPTQQAAAVSFAAVGAFSTSGEAADEASASMVVAFSFGASALPAREATALLSVAGSLTAGALPADIASATLPMTGTLLASGGPTLIVSATLLGTGNLSASGTIPPNGVSAMLTGTAALSAAGEPTDLPAASLIATGALAGTGEPTLIAAATFPATGTLSASGPTQIGATFVLTGKLTVSDYPMDEAAASFAMAVSLAATGSPVVTGAALFPGIGTLNAAGEPSAKVAATLASVFGFNAAGLPSLESAASLSGSLTFAATGSTRVQPAATLGALGSLSGAWLPIEPASVAFQGAGQLVGTGLPIVDFGALFSAAGVLAAGIIPPPSGNVGFGVVGTFTAQWSLPPPLLPVTPQRIIFGPFLSRSATALPPSSRIIFSRYSDRSATAPPVNRSTPTRGQ